MATRALERAHSNGKADANNDGTSKQTATVFDAVAGTTETNPSEIVV